MPRFAANISLMYPEFALIDRIAAAARDGFAAIEVQFPYAVQAAEFRRALDDARMQAVLLNTPPGSAGAELGAAALPGREAEFEAALAQALDYARSIGAALVHVMSGATGAPAAEAGATYARNLTQAARASAVHGITPLIEPLNPRDAPGYFLNSLPQALKFINDVRGVRLQFDAYHLQILHGDLTRRLADAWPAVGHVQVAGVPDRHEPDRGEIAYPHFFATLDRRGYAGWVGAEYRPQDTRPGGTSAGLGWLRRV